MTDNDVLLVEKRDDGIAVLTLHRPDKLNALNAELRARLREAFDALATDDDVRVVVIHGSGEKAFVAGADITEFAARTAMEQREVYTRRRIYETVADFPKPVIAAVHGFCIGGGSELALACDVRVADRTARFSQAEIRIGLIPGGGGTQRLARLVGPARAKDLVFSGRHVKADEALAIGLADKVVPAAEVYEAACSMVRRYVGGPAFALRAAKDAIDRGLETDLESGLEIERMLFAGLFATKDRATGMRSFIEDGPGKATFEGA